MTYDFSNLTNEQEWLICLHGWYLGKMYPDGHQWPQPSPEVVRPLLKCGLLVERHAKYGSARVIEYDVPLVVHLAYCVAAEGAAE